MKGGGGKRDWRDDGEKEKEATLRKEAVMEVTDWAME
jgi:hypothetical protein